MAWRWIGYETVMNFQLILEQLISQPFTQHRTHITWITILGIPRFPLRLHAILSPMHLPECRSFSLVDFKRFLSCSDSGPASLTSHILIYVMKFLATKSIQREKRLYQIWANPQFNNFLHFSSSVHKWKVGYISKDTITYSTIWNVTS